MEDYLTLYQRTEEDRQNPYFAPILENNLKDLPETLVLTAEYDPLRDEGEAYAKNLEEAGNHVNSTGFMVPSMDFSRGNQVSACTGEF